MQADQIDCLKHWKFWTLDSPWHPDKGYPFKNAPSGAFFCWDFPASLIFVSGGEVAWGGQFLFHSGCQIQPNPAPSPQDTKNSDANCDAMWYNLWEIKDSI